MKNNEYLVALFDFDGVVVDTETQYTQFWDNYGNKYFPDVKDFGFIIKGNTLKNIFSMYFKKMPEVQEEIRQDLHRFEEQMSFEYIPGVKCFMKELQKEGFKIAIITSSDNSKMKRAIKVHPELGIMVDCIITADMVVNSKPHPECFLKGAKYFNVPVENCVVFEDSFNGLEAGKRAGMTVVGLATTNPEYRIADKAQIVIPDFTNFTVMDLIKLLKR